MRKGSRKHKKDNRQLKNKYKRRFHCGSEHTGTLGTRREKVVVSDHVVSDRVVSDHNLKDHSISKSHGPASVTKIAAV